MRDALKSSSIRKARKYFGGIPTTAVMFTGVNRGHQHRKTSCGRHQKGVEENLQLRDATGSQNCTRSKGLLRRGKKNAEPKNLLEPDRLYLLIS